MSHRIVPIVSPGARTALLAAALVIVATPCHAQTARRTTAPPGIVGDWILGQPLIPRPEERPDYSDSSYRLYQFAANGTYVRTGSLTAGGILKDGGCGRTFFERITGTYVVRGDTLTLTPKQAVAQWRVCDEVRPAEMTYRSTWHLFRLEQDASGTGTFTVAEDQGRWNVYQRRP